MSNSVFITRLVGPVLLIMGIATCVDRPAFAAIAEETLKSRALLFLSGILTMLGGLAIVLTHNVWGLRWVVVITIFGWLMAIGGAIRILFPARIETMGRAFLRHPMNLCIAGGIWIALGAVFTIFGYVTH